MGIDMEKMRARREALTNKNGNNREMFWKPQDGETTIRIVPTADGDPFKDYWFHYNVGNNPGFLSPKKNFGEDGIILIQLLIENRIPLIFIYLIYIRKKMELFM